MLIALGYVAAFAAAAGVTWLYIVFSDSPEKQASSGMAAFSEMMLFVFLFGAFAAGVTGLGLYALRPRPMLWRVGAIAAVAAALGGVATLAVILFVWLAGRR